MILALPFLIIISIAVAVNALLDWLLNL